MLKRFSSGLLVLNCCFWADPTVSPAQDGGTTARPRMITVDQEDLQSVVDEAPSHSFIWCNRNRELTLSTPVTIRKPLTLVGLSAKLPDNLGKTPLVVVAAAGVTIQNISLTGNVETVDQDNRSPLLIVAADDFRIENCVFRNSTKDGIMIDAESAGDRDITGGVVRDITGYNIMRDLVSISGGTDGARIRNLLVDNIRCYGSELRGSVEVSDGTDNITVRKVYAENCVYAVDVQDHGKPKQVNSNILVEDIYAKNCIQAVRTANRPFGHNNLTLRDITAEQCKYALKLRHTDRIIIQNVRILESEGSPPITISNCDGVSLSTVFAERGEFAEALIQIDDCNDVNVGNIMFRGRGKKLGSIVNYRIKSDEEFSGVSIRGVIAARYEKPPILLENNSKNGSLANYVVPKETSTVDNRIHDNLR